MGNIELFFNRVIIMMSSLFSFKNKLGLVSLAALASYLVFSAVDVRATEMLEDDFLSQNGLHSLSIQKIDGHYYVVQADLKVKQLSLEDMKKYLDKSTSKNEKPKISLKTTRKEIKEERICG
jgi:hypothetical protein